MKLPIVLDGFARDGVGSASVVNGLTIAATSSATLSVASGRSVTFGHSFTTVGAFAVTLTATGTTSLTLPTSGTVATQAYADSGVSTHAALTSTHGVVGNIAGTGSPLSQFAATTSAQLAGVISDETGSGALVFATSPTLTDPVIGNISPGGNLTLTQNGAAVVTSVAAGAVANTLYLATGNVSIGTTLTPGRFNILQDATANTTAAIRVIGSGGDPANYYVEVVPFLSGSDIIYRWSMRNVSTTYSDFLVFKNGNIGVGTITPNLIGHAAGASILTLAGRANGQYGALELAAHGTLTALDAAIGQLEFVNGDGTRASIVGRNGVDALSTSTYLAFYTTNAGVYGERMRITPNGQLRLPTTGDGAGILIGGDALIYRQASGVIGLGDGNRLRLAGESSETSFIIHNENEASDVFTFHASGRFVNTGTAASQSSELSHWIITPSRLNFQSGSGPLANQRFVRLSSPTLSIDGADDVTNAATLYVEAVTKTGGGAGALLNNYSIWAASNVRVDGILGVGEAASGITTAGVHIKGAGGILPVRLFGDGGGNAGAYFTVNMRSDLTTKDNTDNVAWLVDLNSGGLDRMRVRRAPSGANPATWTDIVVFTDASPADLETVMLLRMQYGGNTTTARVKVGAADSGGVGKRALVVDN